MSKSTDLRPTGTTLYFLPVETRVPLKFGAEVFTHGTCARGRMTILGRDGRGGGEFCDQRRAGPCADHVHGSGFSNRV